METATPARPDLLKPDEIAAELRISLPTVFRMFRDGQLPRVKVRDRTFARRADVEQQKRGSAAA